MHANGLRRCEAVSFNKIYVNISALLVLISKCDLCKFLIICLSVLCVTHFRVPLQFILVFSFSGFSYLLCACCVGFCLLCVCVCVCVCADSVTFLQNIEMNHEPKLLKLQDM